VLTRYFFKLLFAMLIALAGPWPQATPPVGAAEVPSDPARFNMAALCLGGSSARYGEDARFFMITLEGRTHVDPEENAWTWINPQQISEASPLLWIFVSPQASIDDALTQALRRYLASGGTVMLEGEGPASFNAMETLRKKVFPSTEAARIAQDALLTRTFYILPDNVAAALQTIRNAGRVVWVESGLPILGGLSAANNDKEMRVRASINIVLYALTGSYKDDLTHLRYLMRRRKS
jgi:hypothetical protein